MSEQPTPIRLPVRDAQSGGNDSPALTLDFFRAALIVSLLAGILPGVWMLLLQLKWHTFAVAPAHWVQIHARAQILGFLLCFILGFSYQAFPRFRGTPLRWPRLARASLPLLLAGLALRIAGELLADAWPGARLTSLAGAVLELLAVLAFVAVTGATARQASPRPSRPGAATHAGYVISAAGWLVISALLGVPESWLLSGQPSGTELMVRRDLWLPALRDLQLHGVILLMVAGVSTRLLPGFLSLPPDTTNRLVRWLPWLNLAVLFEAAGETWAAHTGSLPAWALREVGVLTLAVGVGAMILPLGVFSARANASPPRPFLRSAWLWLGVSLLLAALLPLDPLVLRRPPGHGLMDAARHAFTMGFAMMTVMGISAMVGPALALKPRLPRGLIVASCWLLNVAAALRVGGELASDFTPAAYLATGISGVVALAAFLVWAVPLWNCISTRLPAARWARPQG